ncbi:MAG: 50S ribosomal protein L10 [Lentisphaeria bacterium]|jgi:large subunit ribosomal protein L10
MRSEKLQISKDIQGLLGASDAAFLVSYKGMKVSEFSALRKELRTASSECHVVPNRILRKAAADLGLEGLAAEKTVGETALVAGGLDPARVAKILKQFAKAHPALSFKAGVLDRKLLTKASVEELADLPPREVLLAQLLGVLQAPARNLVSVLNAKAASIVYVLKAIADKKAKEA